MGDKKENEGRKGSVTHLEYSKVVACGYPERFGHLYWSVRKHLYGIIRALPLAVTKPRTVLVMAESSSDLGEAGTRTKQPRSRLRSRQDNQDRDGGRGKKGSACGQAAGY